jgi:hypothetical protein
MKNMSGKQICLALLRAFWLNNNIWKKTIGLFLPQDLVFHFIVHVDIHIVGCVTHVEALVDSDVTSYFIDEKIVQQKYFQLLWKSSEMHHEISNGHTLASRNVINET